VNGRESLKKDQIYLSFFEDDASAVILVYDISNKKSFTDLKTIIRNLEEFFLQNQSIKKYLIANKQDLLGKEADLLGKENFVSVQEGEEFSRVHGFNYCELSTKSGFDGNFDEVFVRIVEEILPACRYNLNFGGVKNGRMGQSDNYMYCVSNKGCNACSIF
jgi:GTPase SAR1 family protein